MAEVYSVNTAGNAGGKSVGGASSVSCKAKIEADIALSIGTNVQHFIGFKGDAVQAYQMVSDVALDIYVNDASDGSPDLHIHLAAGVPITWDTNSIYRNIFNPVTTLPSTTTPIVVTSLYITNAAAANLTFSVGYDPTV